MKKSGVKLAFGFVAGFVLFQWWLRSGSLLVLGGSEALGSIGRLMGLLTVLGVWFQFIVMSRARWLEGVFGLDKLSKLHAKVGKVIISFALLHPILITNAYKSSSQVNYLQQVKIFWSQYDGLAEAYIAIGLFVIVAGTSIQIAKKRLNYEHWHLVHLSTYLAVVLAFEHQLELGTDFVNNVIFVYFWYGMYLFVLLNLIWYRIVIPGVRFRRHEFRVSRIVKERGDAVSIYIEGKQMDEYVIEEGKFMLFRFLQSGFWTEIHPFSLSGREGQKIRITVKQLGDFTSKVDQLRVGTRVWIEGPYGSFTLERSRPGSKLLMIAGGIGITPIVTLVNKAVKQKRDVVLLYANKHSEEVPLKEEIESLVKKGGLTEITVISDEDQYKGEKGRIDREKLERLVKDIKEREIFICGPLEMMKKIALDCESLGVEKGQIYWEEFAL